MRSLVICGSAGLALVLQGCGGGSGGKAGSGSACLNDKINFVTQSFTAKTTGTNTITTKQGTETSNIATTSTQKIDLENWNAFMDLKQEMKVPFAAGKDADVTVESKAIFRSSAHLFAIDYKITNNSDGKTLLKNCTKVAIPEELSPAELSMLFKTVVLPKVQETAKCGSSDGMYDTWHVDSTMLPPTLPVKIPPGTSASADLQLDKDFLLHSAAIKFSGDSGLPEGWDSIKGSIDMQFSDVSPSKPSDADLDFTSWGKCYPAELPGFAGPELAAHSPTLAGLFSRGFIQPQGLAMIAESLKPVDTSAVVV
jgi:hypothetical protein